MPKPLGGVHRIINVRPALLILSVAAWVFCITGCGYEEPQQSEPFRSEASHVIPVTRKGNGGASGHTLGTAGKKGRASGPVIRESDHKGAMSAGSGGPSGQNGGTSGHIGGESGVSRHKGAVSGDSGGSSGQNGGASGHMGDVSGRKGGVSGHERGSSGFGTSGGTSGNNGGQSGHNVGPSGHKGHASRPSGDAFRHRDGGSGHTRGKSGLTSDAFRHNTGASDHTGAGSGHQGGASNHDGLQIIAFGDFGIQNSLMTRTMDMYHSKFPNPDMVFLLGDNMYSHISSTSQYSIWFDHVARKSKAPHYVILGNHDYSNNVDQLMLKAMPAADARWIMPSNYYFKRFERADFTLCVWFLDTEKFTKIQSDWLDKSLAAEKPSCTWTVVNGHHPGLVQGSGPGLGSKYIGKFLEPLLEKHNVDIYMSGHHHNSQHLTNKPAKTNIFIVGQLSLSHPYTGVTTKGQAVWGTGGEPAILELIISAGNIRYAIHSGNRNTGGPIHSGVIYHSP